MALDGIDHGNRVDHTSVSRHHAKVVDQILNSTTFWSRLNGKGEKFDVPTKKYTVKIDRTDQGQFYSGLEALNSSATDTTIELEFGHTAYTHPDVEILLESMANMGSGQDIDLPVFKNEEAMAEAARDLSDAVYLTGADKKPLGLQAIVDDGTDAGTIGGQSRTTYSELNATRTAASGNKLSLSQMATLVDAVSDTGPNESPTIFLSDWSVWSLYESLLQPTVRANYSAEGYQAMGVRSSSPSASKSSLKGMAGFDVLACRGIPMIKDKAATAETLFLLNENYLKWFGRTEVPKNFKGQLEYVRLGKATTLEGQMAKPSDNHGWFWQTKQMLPNQAGMIGRYHVIGQVCVSQPRRQGKLINVQGV